MAWSRDDLMKLASDMETSFRNTYDATGLHVVVPAVLYHSAIDALREAAGEPAKITPANG